MFYVIDLNVMTNKKKTLITTDHRLLYMYILNTMYVQYIP